MTDDLKARLTHSAWCVDILVDPLCKEAAARIAELETAFRVERDNIQSTWQRAEAAEAECERLREATGRLLDMLALGSVKFSLDRSDAWAQFHKAWTDTHTTLAADQKGEREDGMADVSWKRQLERTRNDAWNAALEAATQATEDEDGDLYTKPTPLRTRLKTIIAPSRSLRDTARVVRRNATAAIRNLKRGTP